MTDDFVMPPVGPEMDAMVDAMVGWGSSGKPAPPFSTRMDFALAGLDDWREQHEDWRPFRMGWNYASDRMGLGQHNVYIGGNSVFAPTLAQAICEAIIRAQWAMEDAE